MDKLFTQYGSTFTAQYPSKCVICRCKIKPGDRMVNSRLETLPQKGYMHRTCFDNARNVQHALLLR